MNKDQFGYYQVGDFKTYSKVEAIELAHAKSSLTPRWIFNDETFGNYNWKIEPTETLDELYAQRARQLREKYDYIVVWYSGGADSHNILETFRKNDIFIDEIAQFHAYSGEKSWNSYLNLEVEKIAVPVTLEVLESMPGTKHRMVDMAPFINDVFKEDNNRIDFIYKSNRSFSPHQLARTYFREKIKDYQDIIASGKKLCFVWGGSKPEVVYDEAKDKYYTRFIDCIDSNGVGPRTQQLNREWEYDEMFYWSPDCPELVAKQSHLVKNYMRNLPAIDLNSRWLTTEAGDMRISWDGTRRRVNSKHAHSLVNNVPYYLTVDGLHRLIYTHWNHDTFSLGKTVSFMFGPRDAWWFRATGSDQKNFVYGIESIKKMLGEYLVGSSLGNSNVKLMSSPEYWLE